MKNTAQILDHCISPFSHYCSSSGIDGYGYYISAPLISCATENIDLSHGGSQMLDNIVAFDRAESNFANITQTNMITVSSFNGINGLVWGYDLAKQPLQRHALLNPEKHPEAYDLEPLELATRSLFGTISEKRFPIAPGQHTLCAYKTFFQNGPCTIYGSLALAIAEDREQNADLFMEDHGTFFNHGSEDPSNVQESTVVLESLLTSVHSIGANLGIKYEKVFVSLKSCRVNPGEVGCVITAAPYIHLAQQAVPENRSSLIDMSLSDWEQLTKGRTLGDVQRR